MTGVTYAWCSLYKHDKCYLCLVFYINIYMLPMTGVPYINMTSITYAWCFIYRYMASVTYAWCPYIYMASVTNGYCHLWDAIFTS